MTLKWQTPIDACFIAGSLAQLKTYHYKIQKIQARMKKIRAYIMSLDPSDLAISEMNNIKLTDFDIAREEELEAIDDYAD